MAATLYIHTLSFPSFARSIQYYRSANSPLYIITVYTPPLYADTVHASRCLFSSFPPVFLASHALLPSPFQLAFPRYHYRHPTCNLFGLLGSQYPQCFIA